MKLKHLFENTLAESDWDSEYQRLSKQELEDWCANYLPRHYNIIKTGDGFEIDVVGDITLEPIAFVKAENDLHKLPYPFGEIDGDFYITGAARPIVLENFPKTVRGNFDVRGAIKDFKGMPKIVNENFWVQATLPSWDVLPNEIGSLRLGGTVMDTFTGISNTLKHCREIIFDADEIKRGFLDLIKIEGLKRVTLTGPNARYYVQENENPGKLIVILQDYLDEFEFADRDPLELQCRLLDAGLHEFVKK